VRSFLKQELIESAAEGDVYTNRTAGIVIALFLAVVCALLINIGANKRYVNATRTVQVQEATRFIPAGEKISTDMVKTVDVPQQMAEYLATGAAGQYTKVPVMQNQLLMKDDLNTTGKDTGYAEVYVPVDVPSSACAISGDYVDVYTKAGNNSPSVLLYQKAKVLNVVDSSAEETEPGSKPAGVTAAAASGTAVAIGIEIPSNQAIQIVGPASMKQIYLVQSAL